MLGCINDEYDEMLLANVQYWDSMATGIANGIDQYFEGDRELENHWYYIAIINHSCQ